jgi:hypothetical protein
MSCCQNCHSPRAVTRLHCGACDLTLEGQFGTPRLSRLAAEDQQLMEAFVLAGGNLKSLAEELGLSYPTVRKRIDALISAVREIRSRDEEQARIWLQEVEAGSLRAETAARLMRETAYG